MEYQRKGILRSVLTDGAAPRVAVVGAGIAGLTCARELLLRGFDPVVFEADARPGGRCSSRSTRVGVFDDAAQSIKGATRLSAYAAQGPHELAPLHAWTVAATPAEEERKDKGWAKHESDIEFTPSLKLLGAVGVPSMLALAQALARPLDIRLRTPIWQTQKRGLHWVLRGPGGEIDEDFQALVLALPAPLALPLARESAELSESLRVVRYRSRWVLLLGSERPVGLPGYQEFQGSPIERIAAMHSKPGRGATGPQRWFIEADARWSSEHEKDDADHVADLLLENFRAHARRSVTPHYLGAHHWRHAFVETPAATRGRAGCLWDSAARIGICGDSVVASRVDRVHVSGVAMARAVFDGLTSRLEGQAVDLVGLEGRPGGARLAGRNQGQQLEAQS